MAKKILVWMMILACMLSMFNVVGYAEETVVSTPYKNHIIPGTLPLIEFDNGGLGVAYDPGSVVKSAYHTFRSETPFNFYDFAGDGTGMAMVGGWVKYTVNVAATSKYNVVMKYNIGSGSCNLNLLVNEEPVLTDFPVPNTGSWYSFEEINLGDIPLNAGKNVLTFKINSGITLLNMVFTDLNGNNVDISPQSGAYRNHFIPCRIEAEDYDIAPEGCESIDGVNNGKKYRKNDPIDLYEVTRDNFYAQLAYGESVTYTFNVENSNAYTLQASVKTDCDASIYFDDRPVPVKTTLRADGDFMVNDIISVYLPKGEHKIKYVSNGSALIDYLQFKDANEEYIMLSTLDKEPEEDEKISSVYKNLYVSLTGDDGNDGSQGSPFKTLERAKEEIASINNDMTGDIIINLMPGYYKLDKSLEFTPEECGKNGYKVIIRGASGSDRAIIGGGTRITGWTKLDSGIWKAPADIEDTRTLYVNDFMAQRAKSKYIYSPASEGKFDDSEYMADYITISKVNFPDKFYCPENVELVWDVLWTCQRTPVKDIVDAGDSKQIIFDQPYYHWQRAQSYQDTAVGMGKKFYIENDLSLLDEQGEFYFDKEKKEIYYFPYNEEDMQTAETYAGTTDLLVSVKGTIDNHAVGIEFDNIEFKYGAWNKASEVGVNGIQGEKMQDIGDNQVQTGGYALPAQLAFDFAKNIAVTNCRFTCLGSAAINMEDGVENAKITGNVFKEISGCAVEVGSWDHNNQMPEGMERCKSIEIGNNVIRRVAAEFRGSCGISLYYVNNVNVHHNDIKEVPYTGITMGWGWGVDVRDCANNTISNNRIEDVTGATLDGAHIYTLGPMRNSVIKGNYLIKAGDARGGIYFDSASGFLTATDNVVEKCAQWLHAPNAGYQSDTVTNTYVDTEEHVAQSGVSVSETHLKQGGTWSKEAQAIIDAAGVEDAYKYLLDDVERPVWRPCTFRRRPTTSFKTSDIQAENYMAGGEGVGFHKNDGGEVKIWPQGTELVVGTTFAGEWLCYKVNIEKSQEYNLRIVAANDFSDSEPQPKGNVYVDDELVFENIDIPKTGSWQKHIPVEAGKLNLTEGTHIFKFEFVENGYSFDCWRLYADDETTSDDFDEGIINSRYTYFHDIIGHWAQEYIEEMANKKVVYGVSETEFAPENDVTLYQAIWLALRTAGVEYTDNSWKSDAVGYEMLSNVNEADRPVSREEFAKIAINAYTIDPKNKISLTYTTVAFGDFAEIEETKKMYVLAAKSLGLVVGDENGNFNPQKTLSRAEAVTIIKRLYDVM